MIYIDVCDQSEKIRENIEKNYGLKTYNNVEDMLENEKIDAASIVTPDHLHVEPALACIEKGVDLLIEKPLATSVADCKKIYEAAKKNKVRVAVDFHKRWDPAAIFIYNKLKSSKGYPLRAYMNMDDIIDVPTEWFKWGGSSDPVDFFGRIHEFSKVHIHPFSKFPLKLQKEQSLLLPYPKFVLFPE